MTDFVLTAPMYAAIQAHESTLPLPSAGAPMPMFGMIGGAGNGYAVGQGGFSSGGTAEASISLGLLPGQTNQDLFPSVLNGILAFDRLIRLNDPGAIEYVQSTGDFCGFLSRIAPWYAGPGEAPGFSSQTCEIWHNGQGQIASFQNAMEGGVDFPITEPGVSFGLDIAAAPQAQSQDLPPAPQPQQDIPPPYIPPEITIPQLNEAEDGADGFDNIVRYYKRDLPYLVAYDNALIREITQLTGG